MLNDNRQQGQTLGVMLRTPYRVTTRLLRWFKGQSTVDILDVILLVALTGITVLYGWILN